MDGYGKLFYPPGDDVYASAEKSTEKLAYEGEWKNNAFNGKGKVYNEEPQPLNGNFNCYDTFDNLGEHWEYYEGEFVNDAKQGVGTLMLINGEKYIGQFYEDMIHGRGAFYNIMGEVVSGEWDLNRYNNS